MRQVIVQDGTESLFTILLFNLAGLYRLDRYGWTCATALHCASLQTGRQAPASPWWHAGKPRQNTTPQKRKDIFGGIIVVVLS